MDSTASQCGSTDESFWSTVPSIQIVETVLDEIGGLLNQMGLQGMDGPEIFHEWFPDSDIIVLLTAIIEKAGHTDDIILCALFYADMLSLKHSFLLTPKNQYRLLLTAVIISEKYNMDKHNSLTFYSRLSGLSIPELFQQECTFLQLIDYNLSTMEYPEYREKLQQQYLQIKKQEIDI